MATENDPKAPSSENKSTDAVLEDLKTRRKGLSADEAKNRLDRYGPNSLAETRTNPILKFLGYFWGPIPWMIEVAAILSLVVRHWSDFIIIVVLLLFNAVVGFWQEFQAGSAIDALKQKLALKARALRNNKWQQIPAKELVPGDIIRLRLGDVIPADAVLIEGDYLSVDQSGLTGESLPVSKKKGDTAYSGSVTKQGEMVAVVTQTGASTYFGRTAKLVEGAGAVSHFQKAVMHIGNYLILLSIGLVSILVITQIFRQAPLLEVAQFSLILVVASIPVAMPAVLSVTMAVGAVSLSRQKAIVSRLESIEEMAGIDILCSDKTGTLTENHLTLGDPITVKAENQQDLILAAALASDEDNGDAIDLAVVGGLQDKQATQNFDVENYVPFDPVSKRTEATVRDEKGRKIKVSKGAPQVIIDLVGLGGDDRSEIEEKVDELAGKGYRTLGVARTDSQKSWQFLGILPLYDPPREDSADVISQARDHGIQMKMVTGDNTSIARQIASQLGMQENIAPADQFFEADTDPDDLSESQITKIEKADGFSQVFPEHKYGIVRALQSRGHLVGMTGDGVNDAPALKQAEVGIAVSGATDAARSAATLVLTAPGLSVIVSAVEQARRIFERMNSYAIYRIAETIRIMFFIVLSMLVYDFYPITAIMIILLALLNDLPIMTIAYDNTWLEPKPVQWQMQRTLTVSSVLGGIGVIETFLLLVFAHSYLGIDQQTIQSIVFLKLVVAGHLTLFVARSRKPFFARPFPSPLLLGAVIGTEVVAILIVASGWIIPALPWTYILAIVGYCLAWLFIEDAAKLLIYRHLGFGGKHHKKFLGILKQPLAHQ